MRKVKLLGIATVMALALTAVLGVTSASASWFLSGASGTTLEGSRSGSSHVLDLGGETFTCKNVSFAGVMPGTMDSKVTTSPELQSCKVPGFQGDVNWGTNDCKFRFNTGSGASLVGTVDIVGCTSPMSVNYNGYCKVEIGNQNGIGTVEYSNVTEKEFTATANLKGITFTRSGGGYCAAAPGTFNNGLYAGTWTVKGSLSGSQIPVSVVVTPPAPTIFAAEVAPVTLSATKISSKAFNFGENGYVTCGNYTYSGTSATAQTGALTVIPTYKSCEWHSVDNSEIVAIPDGNVTAGQCSLVLHASGGLDIAGASCASSPMSITLTGCVITMGPQSQSGLSYVNEGSGKLRTVQMTGNTSALDYTATGGSCDAPGASSSGSFKNRVVISATNSGGAQQGISVE